MGMSDGALNFVREMTFGLGSDVLGMLSYEYHGLLENPGETLKQNAQSLSMLRALLFPISKEEVEIRNNALSGIWNEIKTSINSNLINGDPYTASRFVTDLGLNIASLFFGAGELKAASGVKKTDNVVDGLRAIDKVSDANKLSNGEKWFNYFNKAYGVENVEWTSRIFEGNAALRERVFANIEMSRLARESSNYSDFAKFERDFINKLMAGTNKSFPKRIPYEFMNDTADHIFKGVVKDIGTASERATGWHYIGSDIPEGNEIIQITRKADEFGTIEARVKIGGVTKKDISTFFSNRYTPDEVVDMIMQAHMNKKLVPGSRGLYRGVAYNGMTIEMYLYRNPQGTNISDIITAYPVHVETLK